MTKILPNMEARNTHHYNGDPVVPASAQKYGYVWVSRAKKSHNWVEVARCYSAGDNCLRNAQIHFSKHGFVETDYSLGKLLPLDEWLHYAVNRHLKSVGIKSK